MKFDVTQEDIDQGFRGSCSLCPVATCMSRTLGVAVEIISKEQPSRIRAWLPDRNYLLPMDVHQWVFRFDRFFPVTPFSFELDIP